MKNSKMYGNISTIETMGLVDGPGIRVVVFMQGCTLRCLYCHNPETWESKDNKIISVDELIEKILKYKNYIQKHGGVTFSGGEPLLQSKFIFECSKRLKQEGLHVCIDTSGIGYDYNELIENVDLVILDVKSIREDEYKYITGHTIEKYNQFLTDVQKINVKIWLRQVIVPGINDDEEHIIELANYAKSLKNIEKVELLPYRSYCENKYVSLNIKYKLKDVDDLGKEKEQYLNEILKKKDCVDRHSPLVYARSFSSAARRTASVNTDIARARSASEGYEGARRRFLSSGSTP